VRGRILHMGANKTWKLAFDQELRKNTLMISDYLFTFISGERLLAL